MIDNLKGELKESQLEKIEIEDQLKNKEIELKRNQYQGNNMESDRCSNQTFFNLLNFVLGMTSVI